MSNHEPLTPNPQPLTPNVPVVILCGGLGLRLRSVVQDKPKCLAPIGGRPFLEWLLANLRCQGFTNILLCLGYGSDQVLEFLQRRETPLQRRETRDERQATPAGANTSCSSELQVSDSGRRQAQDHRAPQRIGQPAPQMEIRHVLEQQPLGTAGALRNAASLIQENQFLAMNGDTMLDVDFQALLRSHTQRDALATMAVWRNPESAARYGDVDVDAEGRITRFSEKRSAGLQPGTMTNVGLQSGAAPNAGLKAGATSVSFINGGVYAFAREIFDRMPGAPASVSLEKDIFPSLVGQRFYGFPCDGYFLDIGIPEDYQKAQTELPERFILW
jgi:D-glycero-alpha-D-manno-heptose 1-phosphate guanylyltransferase